MKKISELTDSQLAKLIDNRWDSSETVWDIVKKTYEKNLSVYQNEPGYLKDLPRKKSKVRANRIFVNTEAVINSLIANPPKPTVIPGRETPESKALALNQEKYFQIKYTERNVKEVIRKGLRNLYLSRLLVLKPFWNAKINDFDVRALDPRKVRCGKKATKEDDSEFFVEEIEDDLLAVMRRFPKKKDELLKLKGYESEEEALINNPEVKYKEAWIRDYVIFKLDTIILGKIRNPYFDWDGLLITPEEEENLKQMEGEGRRVALSSIKGEQEKRKAMLAQKIAFKEAEAKGEALPVLENSDEAPNLQAYYFNHFDQPRKPYIIATIFNNENSPIGQTDMISQAIPLQEDVDETKRNITENAKLVNGTLKVDSSVMDKASATAIRYETGGLIWGKGVVAGVQREMGTPLPDFVVGNMQDSRTQIDDIMAASSAFKGQREGQETKGGRLALIEQSFLRLNELVQVIDYVNFELFNWFYQLAKVRYTEHHYAKTEGKAKAIETITLIQDDFEDGSEIRIIPGKTLPEDRQFKYEQAQGDVKEGILSPVDYFEVAGYDSPAEKAKNRVLYDLNKPVAVGITGEELAKLAPPSEGDPPSISIKYGELPPDGQIQAAAKAGITLDPQLLLAEKMKEQNNKKEELEAKKKAPVGPEISPKI